jgi:hypothetical protein
MYVPSVSHFVRQKEILWLLPSLPVAVLLVFTRGYPTTGSDTGIFLSVAGRLLAGDKLYRDVFDNKDPLFYFSQSFALWIAGWRGPFLIDIAWLTVASASTYLLLRALTGDRIVAVFGQLLYPLLLTGFHYYAADSETPALSLVPLFAYFVYRGRQNLAGLVGASTVLLRVNLLPVVGAIALGRFLFVREPESRRDVLALMRSAAAGIGLIFLVLAVRGEAGAYVATLRQNADYASRLLTFHHLPTGVRGHLLVVWNAMPTSTWYFMGAVLVLLAVATFSGGQARARVVPSQLMVLTAFALGGTLIALAGTALWDHHLQILAFPIACGACLGVDCLSKALKGSHGRLRQLATVGTVGFFFLLVSLLGDPPSVWKLHQWTMRPNTAVSDALYAAAGQGHQTRSGLSYFHFGENDETGSGAFLNGAFRLACPRFHQYPFLAPEQLRQTIRCVKQEEPQLIAVTPSFKDYQGNGPFSAWNRFVRSGREYLRSHCQRVIVRAKARVYRCGPIR